MLHEPKAKFLQSLAIIILLYFVRTLIVKLLIKRIEDVRNRYRWKEAIDYLSIVMGLMLLGHIWIEGIKSILTFLALISAGLTIVLKEIILNLASWIIILWRRLFNVGDRIQIGDYIGDVIELGLFYFTLIEVGRWVYADQSTGRIVKVPNGLVLTQPVANYNKGIPYIWDEIRVPLSAESNWKKAKDILKGIVNIHVENLSGLAEKFLKETDKEIIIYKKLTPTVYTTFKEGCIMLTVRYLCEPRNRRDTEHVIWENILEEFSKYNDINLMYYKE